MLCRAVLCSQVCPLPCSPRALWRRRLVPAAHAGPRSSVAATATEAAAVLDEEGAQVQRGRPPQPAVSKQPGMMPQRASLPPEQQQLGEQGKGGGGSTAVATGTVKDDTARRRKISEANKGRIPWNTGKQHSPGG